jgi:YD repeat-containing protein
MKQIILLFGVIVVICACSKDVQLIQEQENETKLQRESTSVFDISDLERASVQLTQTSQISVRRLSRKNFLLSSGDLYYWFEYDYDPFGRLITITQFYFIDALHGDPQALREVDSVTENYTQSSTTRYEYNEADQLFREFFSDSSGMALPYTISYTYNDEGWLVQKSLCYDDNRCEIILYNHDGAGNIIREVPKTPEGTARGWTTHEYDSQGRKVRTDFFQHLGRSTTFETFEYDQAGRLIRENRFYDSGKLEYYRMFSFDQSGELLQATVYRGEETAEYERYEYALFLTIL